MAKKALITALLFSVLLSLVLSVGCGVDTKKDTSNPAEENPLSPGDNDGQDTPSEGGGLTADTIAPVLSNIAATQITATGAKITWTTDEPATSQIEYGLNSASGSNPVTDTASVTSHRISLVGLTASTTYHYRVRSVDSHGNVAVSAESAFTTAQDAAIQPPAEAPPLSLQILSVTSPVCKGYYATLSARTAPGAQCTTVVSYESGPVEAQGLYAKIADSNGDVSWTWEVDAGTASGSWPVTVTASLGDKITSETTYFTVE